jgi:predicted Zn-dependent peptidase
MRMNKLEYPHIKETLYHEVLDNGLNVYVLPKPGFSKYFATFTTKYGSMDNRFVPVGKEDYITVPDGIAHFLEHKMFATEEGDVFDEFTKYSANSNAFTSFDRTAYLFSCTSHFKENLNILLNMVQEVYLTDENVEKEKGIIAQEIKMYDDNPDWRLYFGTIESMYKDHVVKTDIAGTVDSIYQITKETLTDCYNTFYHPTNMLLFVVGDVNPEETLAWIKENQHAKSFIELQEVKRDYIFETNEVARKEHILNMEVFTPKVAVGIKDHLSKRQGKDLMKYEILLDIIFDHLFSKSSDYYQEMLDLELINDSFGYELTVEYSYGFGVVSSDTKKPEELASKLREILLNARELKMSEADFTVIKNKLLGRSIKALNSTENIANTFTRYQFNQMNMFDALTIYEELTLSDLEEVLPFFAEQAITTTIIYPKK